MSILTLATRLIGLFFLVLQIHAFQKHMTQRSASSVCQCRTMTQCTLSSLPSPHSWQPRHCVSLSANMWALSFVWPVISPTTPMMQLQILVTHSLRPKTTAVTLVSAESLHNYTESFLPPIFFNICIFTYLWSWYAFQKSRTYLPVPYCTNINRQLYISKQRSDESQIGM